MFTYSKSFFQRIENHIELFLVCTFGKFFGIRFIVRYLRNPNPNISAKVLRFFGASIGHKTGFKRSILFDNVYEDIESKGDFSNLTIGSNCYIGDSVYFDLVEKITIEDNSVIAGKVSFLTHQDCNLSFFLNDVFPRKVGAIVIGTGSWIGFGTTILLGVHVGQNSAIAACSLIKTDVKTKTLFAGVPAMFIRSLDVRGKNEKN